MLCGQAKISELFPPHSAFAVSGLFLLKFFFWAFHHRVPGSDSWGESVKAYFILNFSSRTSKFIRRQNVGLRTCLSSPIRCRRVFSVWLHHLAVAPQSGSGNNYPPVVLTLAGMWCMGGSVESSISVRSLWGGEWPWRLATSLYLSHLPGPTVKLLGTLNVIQGMISQVYCLTMSGKW